MPKHIPRTGNATNDAHVRTHPVLQELEPRWRKLYLEILIRAKVIVDADGQTDRQDNSIKGF